MTYFHPLAAPFHLEGSNGEGVLLVHGFGGTPAHLRMLGGFLHDHQYTVHGALLAGHGTCLEDMESTGRLDWLNSARTSYRLLADSCERVHLVGFSMGALLCLRLAAESGPASLTILNAPMKLHDRRHPLARVLQYVQRFRLWAGEAPPPDDEARHYWVQYEGFSVRSAVELLNLISATKRILHEVTCPLLVIQSRADESVKPVSAEIITRRVSSFRKQLLWLDRSRHNSLLDRERSTIHQKILDYLRSSTSH